MWHDLTGNSLKVLKDLSNNNLDNTKIINKKGDIEMCIRDRIISEDNDLDGVVY